MEIQLGRRLEELKFEFEKGQIKLAEVDEQATNLRNSLLRISGAIQVLEEELAKDNGDRERMSSAKALEVAENGVVDVTNKVVNM